MALTHKLRLKDTLTIFERLFGSDKPSAPNCSTQSIKDIKAELEDQRDSEATAQVRKEHILNYSKNKCAITQTAVLLENSCKSRLKEKYKKGDEIIDEMVEFLREANTHSSPVRSKVLTNGGVGRLVLFPNSSEKVSTRITQTRSRKVTQLVGKRHLKSNLTAGSKTMEASRDAGSVSMRRLHSEVGIKEFKSSYARISQYQQQQNETLQTGPVVMIGQANSVASAPKVRSIFGYRGGPIYPRLTSSATTALGKGPEQEQGQEESFNRVIGDQQIRSKNGSSKVSFTTPRMFRNCDGVDMRRRLPMFSPTLPHRRNNSITEDNSTSPTSSPLATFGQPTACVGGSETSGSRTGNSGPPKSSASLMMPAVPQSYINQYSNSPLILKGIVMEVVDTSATARSRMEMDLNPISNGTSVISVTGLPSRLSIKKQNATNKPNNKTSEDDLKTSSYPYPDPLFNASASFIQRLNEISSIETETVRMERSKELRKKIRMTKSEYAY